MAKFQCIFPALKNFMLTKDVGMIPYKLSSNYNVSLISYNNDEYTYLSDIFNDQIELKFIENTGNEKDDIKSYIKENIKDIDVIQFYHLRYSNLACYIFYIKLLNPKTKIYLKLDANNHIIDFLTQRKGFKASMRRQLTRILFKFIDVISIETKRNYKQLINSNVVDEDKLLYLPNGIIKTDVDVNCKENIILYAGYIEKKNKSIDMLIDAMHGVDKSWKLVLVGEVVDDMHEFIDEYFKQNPDMKDQIIFEGYISDKQLLAEYYAKSSIYCCTSKRESFGISTLEAAYHGNYIISTDVGGSKDIINTTRYGKLIEHTVEDLRNTLIETTNNWENIKQNPEVIQKKVYEDFSWDNIVEKLASKLK